MKDFFAVDVFTGSSESDKIIQRTLDKKLEDNQREYTKKMQNYENRAKMPTVLSTIMVVSMVVAFCVLAAFFGKLSGMSDGQTLVLTDWAMLIFGLVFTGVSIALWWHKKLRVKKIAQSEEYRNFLKDWEALYKKCEQDLKIPRNAKTIDVFLYVYTSKGGKEKPAYKTFNYVNANVKLFVEGNMVMLADQQTVFGFDRKWFKGFEVVKEAVTFNNWHKEKPITSEEYKKYGIKANNYGVFVVKNAVKLFIERDGTQSFILVPPYESDNLLHAFGCNQKVGKSK